MVRPEDLVNKVDHLFVVGDLNYRLELPRDEVDWQIRKVRGANKDQSSSGHND